MRVVRLAVGAVVAASLAMLLFLFIAAASIVIKWIAAFFNVPLGFQLFIILVWMASGVVFMWEHGDGGRRWPWEKGGSGE